MSSHATGYWRVKSSCKHRVLTEMKKHNTYKCPGDFGGSRTSDEGDIDPIAA